MLFSRKKNIFMCLIAFQKMFRKIFSDVWLCSWKYHRKHIFYLLLTFSRLPNEYIISFIPQNANKTQKKNHQIRINEGEIAIGAVSASRDRDWRIARYRSKLRAITIDAFTLSRSKLRAIAIGTMPVMLAKGTVPVMSRSLLSFSLSLSLSLFYFPRPEVIWSENGNGNDFPLFWLWNSVNWKCFSVWPNFK